MNKFENIKLLTEGSYKVKELIASCNEHEDPIKHRTLLNINNYIYEQLYKLNTGDESFGCDIMDSDI